LVNIGVLNINLIKEYSVSGVLMRSAGIKKDLRINDPYAAYKYIGFNSYIGNNGDCYDRFLLRLLEMGESLSIILTTAD
jgi:NADH:ubiquinone oxidoreductase subunit D